MKGFILNECISTLLSDWKNEYNKKFKGLQTGRFEDDEHTYSHGAGTYLSGCIEELEDVVSQMDEEEWQNMKNDSKYKLFRNYMTNELEITREDIKDWTIEAVERIAKDSTYQINIRELIQRAVRDEIREIRGDISGQVAKELTQRMQIIFDGKAA